MIQVQRINYQKGSVTSETLAICVGIYFTSESPSDLFELGDIFFVHVMAPTFPSLSLHGHSLNEAFTLFCLFPAVVR
jgi:hypothetical protein